MSEPNHHTTKFFTENLLTMNEPVYLGLSVIGIMKDELDDKVGWILSKNL